MLEPMIDLNDDPIIQHIDKKVRDVIVDLLSENSIITDFLHVAATVYTERYTAAYKTPPEPYDVLAFVHQRWMQILLRTKELMETQFKEFLAAEERMQNDPVIELFTIAGIRVVVFE